MFAGIIGLYLTGNTINLMTLGGLALAIGMLVDDATVAVENIHRNRTLGKPLTVAILDGSHEVALPRTMATLAICIVFFPVAFLYGVSKFLFTPLALDGGVLAAGVVRAVVHAGADAVARSCWRARSMRCRARQRAQLGRSR